MERKLRKKLKGGKFDNVSPQRSKIMSSIRGKGNHSTEILFRMALTRAAIKGWKVNPGGIVGKPDFLFPEANIIVFVDGCFWHGCPKCGHIPKTNNAFWKAKINRNRQRDTATKKTLQESGYYVIRVWEHEIRDGVDECVKKLKKMASKRIKEELDRADFQAQQSICE